MAYFQTANQASIVFPQIHTVIEGSHKLAVTVETAGYRYGLLRIVRPRQYDVHWPVTNVDDPPPDSRWHRIHIM